MKFLKYIVNTNKVEGKQLIIVNAALRIMYDLCFTNKTIVSRNSNESQTYGRGELSAQNSKMYRNMVYYIYGSINLTSESVLSERKSILAEQSFFNITLTSVETE